MQPPVAVPANGGPSSVARVARPAFEKVTCTIGHAARIAFLAAPGCGSSRRRRVPRGSRCLVEVTADVDFLRCAAWARVAWRRRPPSGLSGGLGAGCCWRDLGSTVVVEATRCLPPGRPLPSMASRIWRLSRCSAARRSRTGVRAVPGRCLALRDPLGRPVASLRRWRCGRLGRRGSSSLPTSRLRAPSSDCRCPSHRHDNGHRTERGGEEERHDALLLLGRRRSAATRLRGRRRFSALRRSAASACPRARARERSLRQARRCRNRPRHRWSRWSALRRDRWREAGCRPTHRSP